MTKTKTLCINAKQGRGKYADVIAYLVDRKAKTGMMLSETVAATVRASGGFKAWAKGKAKR